MKNDNIWPKIFTTGVIPPGYSKKKLMADCLIAYSWVNLKYKPPKLFFPTLFLISKKIGFLATKENLLFHVKSRGALA